MKLRDANLQVNEKRLIHTSSFMYFAFTFSEYSTITSSKEVLKMCEGALFLSGNKVKSRANLGIPDPGP